MNEATKKVRTSSVIIAVLAVIVLVQTVVLVQQNRKQEQFEKRQAELQGLKKTSHKQRLAQPAQRSRTPDRAARVAAYADPWESFDDLSQRMNHLMRHAFTFGSPLFQNMPVSGGFDFTPAVDFEETKDAYVVKSDLPGLEKDKIHITVRDNILTIEGLRETAQETQDAKDGYYAQERSYGSFSRSLSLPGPVEESKIAASYKDGVLTVTLPKAAGQKNAQRVTIQ